MYYKCIIMYYMDNEFAPYVVAGMHPMAIFRVLAKMRLFRCWRE